MTILPTKRPAPPAEETVEANSPNVSEILFTYYGR